MKNKMSSYTANKGNLINIIYSFIYSGSKYFYNSHWKIAE